MAKKAPDDSSNKYNTDTGQLNPKYGGATIAIPIQPANPVTQIPTARIVWVSHKSPDPMCGFTKEQLKDPEWARSCYTPKNNTAYVSRDDGDTAFAMYHELGHSIYLENFPHDIFKSSAFGPDYESIANDFAWYMKAQANPKKNGAFVKSVISPAKLDYFSRTCDSKCVAKILSIKIPK